MLLKCRAVLVLKCFGKEKCDECNIYKLDGPIVVIIVAGEFRLISIHSASVSSTVSTSAT